LGVCVVEAVAVSTVVVAVGSDGGAGAWNDTRWVRLLSPSLDPLQIDPEIDGAAE
jgi:hypothetical protein